jgi:hypothetical protein
MDEVARELLRAQEFTMKQILIAQETISVRLNTITGDMAGLRAESKVIGRDTAALCRIVRDGNGTESLVSQVKANEGRIRGLGRRLDTIAVKEKDNQEGRWKVRAALVTSFLALVGTIIVAIL